MHELTPENALAYLQATGRVTGPARVEALGGGVSNLVLRVITEAGPFVLKQSRPQLRTRDPWFSDLERVYREQEVMQALAPLVPHGIVPQVLFADRPNFVFAMAHAPAEARVWKEDLLGGHIDEKLGRRVGHILGLIHETSALHRDRFEAFRDAHVFTQLRVDPFYRRVQERRPEVARPLGALIEQMLTLHQALCHGDYTPKNMLIHDGGFLLVDYETAYLGDPTMDLGLCLAHLVLKAQRLPAQSAHFLKLMRAFWTGYKAAVTFRPAGELESRAIAHLGACLLARIDGSSPVDYLPEEDKRGAIRDLGRRILLDNIAQWSEVEALLKEKETGEGEKKPLSS
ncbi:MAG TPA: aminoglycoside phosphotransferase family protein [Gemmataceae bacterium]|nr:aminoglycoside phosphotransferase family protein [Gemmataceae bacterium]